MKVKNVVGENHADPKQFTKTLSKAPKKKEAAKPSRVEQMAKQARLMGSVR